MNFGRLIALIFDASQPENENWSLDSSKKRILLAWQIENEFWSFDSTHFWRFAAWKWKLVFSQHAFLTFHSLKMNFGRLAPQKTFFRAVKRPKFIFKLWNVKNACCEATKIHFQTVKRQKCVLWSDQNSFQTVKRQKCVVSNVKNVFLICPFIVFVEKSTNVDLNVKI